MVAQPIVEKSYFEKCSHTMSLSANVVSPSLIGTNNNTRWNRNDFYRDHKMDDTNNVFTILSSSVANLKSAKRLLIHYVKRQ